MGVAINRTARFSQSDFGAPSPHRRARFRASSAGPVAPLLAAGRAQTEPYRPLVASVSPNGHRPTGSSRLPALTRPVRTAATHAREDVRTYKPEAPSVVVAIRAHRVSPMPAERSLLLPGLIGAKLTHPFALGSPPSSASADHTVGSGLAPHLSAYGKDASDSTSASHFLRCEHPRLVGSGSPSFDVAIQGPGFSRSRAHFGGAIVLAAGVVFPSFTDRPSL